MDCGGSCVGYRTGLILLAVFADMGALCDLYLYSCAICLCDVFHSRDGWEGLLAFIHYDRVGVCSSSGDVWGKNGVLLEQTISPPCHE